MLKDEIEKKMISKRRTQKNNPSLPKLTHKNHDLGYATEIAS
jgi:hypothetical protein